jgi:hypothetical protein
MVVGKSKSSLLLPGLLGLAVLFGCSKKENADKTSQESNQKIDMSFGGQYQGTEGPDHQLVITRGGLMSTGIMCSQSYTFAKITCQKDECDWTSKEESPPVTGTITRMDGGKLMLSTSGVHCSSRGLSGSFSKDLTKEADAPTSANPGKPATEQAADPPTRTPSRRTGATGEPDMACRGECNASLLECNSACGGECSAAQASKCLAQLTRCASKCQ